MVWAVNEGTQTQVEMLIADGVDVELRDRHHWTALFHAAAAGEVGKATALLNAKADTEARDRHDRTPLMLATHYGQQGTVELLVGAGALGSEYHIPTCPDKVEMTAGEAEMAAKNR